MYLTIVDLNDDNHDVNKKFESKQISFVKWSLGLHITSNTKEGRNVIPSSISKSELGLGFEFLREQSPRLLVKFSHSPPGGQYKSLFLHLCGVSSRTDIMTEFKFKSLSLDLEGKYVSFTRAQYVSDNQADNLMRNAFV